MKNRIVPFFSNTPDDTHCFQAALKMVLKYFLPEKEFTFDELDKLTAKKEGLWTWATQGILNLHQMGFDIIDIDGFEIEKFIKNGNKYLITKYGEEVGKAQIENSDIDQEREIFKKYLPLKIHKTALPTLTLIKDLINKGYLVVCNVNAYALDKEENYAGHFVVISDYDAKGFLLHDPGLPPYPNRKVSYKNFTRAWEYPIKEAKNLIAFKYKLSGQ